MSKNLYTYNFSCPSCDNSFRIQFQSTKKKHNVDFNCKKCDWRINNELEFKTNESVIQLFDRSPSPNKIIYRRGNSNASFLFDSNCFISINELSDEVELSLEESEGAAIMIKGEWDISLQKMNLFIKSLNPTYKIRLHFEDAKIDIPYVFTPIQNDEILFIGNVSIQMKSYDSLYTINTPEYT